MLRSQPDHVGGRHLAEPLAIEAHLGALAIEHLEGLLLVRLGVRLNLLPGKRLPRLGSAGRVPDHPGEVPDDEDHRVALVLEFAQFVEPHNMPQMDIRRRWVRAILDAQRAVPLQLVAQLVRGEQVDGPRRQGFEIHVKRIATKRHKKAQKTARP